MTDVDIHTRLAEAEGQRDTLSKQVDGLMAEVGRLQAELRQSKGGITTYVEACEAGRKEIARLKELAAQLPPSHEVTRLRELCDGLVKRCAFYRQGITDIIATGTIVGKTHIDMARKLIDDAAKVQ